jgi:hypothetical protein
MRHFHDNTIRPETTFSVIGQQSGFNYLLSADMAPWYKKEESVERSMHPDLSFNEIISLERETDRSSYTFNSNLSWGLNEKVRLALNLFYNKNDPPREFLINAE